MFGLLRSAPMLDDRQISDLVQRFYDFELEDENRLRLATGVEFDEANRQAAVGYYDRLLDDLRGALARNELYKADKLVDALLQRAGIAADLDPAARARLGQAMLRVSCDLAGAMKARFEGEFNYAPKDTLLFGDGLSAQASAGVGPRPKKLSDANAPLFSIRAEEFRKMRERRGVWDGQTAFQARKTYQLFAELCGDKRLALYSRDDAVQFKNLLCDLPALYGTSAQYRGMVAKKIAEVSKDNGEPRLSARTVQRHLSALSCLWDEELEAKRLDANIFKNFKLPAAKRPKDQRAMWPSSKLKLLFDTAIWRGCHSLSRRSREGKWVIRDDRFWLPLIALFSGMRQEEICQLELGDLRLEEGIWVFDIHGRGERKVKNLTAVRLVPVHSELIRMGLLIYAEEIGKAGHKRLFPKMERGGADQRFGHNYAKWFTRYRRDVGLYEPGLDFHSFRHSATTFMAQAGVTSEVIDRVTGHVTAGETARYTKQFRIEQLRDAIEAIDPAIDLSFLYPENSESS
jgi:integrase